MLDKTDYAQQIRFINAIDDEIISETSRVVCYNQTIYDDMRVEANEYAGLTLGVARATVLTVVEPMYDYAAILIVDDDSKFKIKYALTYGCI